MIQAKLRGWMPWAHLPFIGRPRRLLRRRRRPRDPPAACTVARDVVGPHHARALRHRPGGGGERALEAVVGGSAGSPARGRHAAARASAQEPAEERLAAGADDAPGSRWRPARRGGRAGPGCARRVLPKPMPGIDPDLVDAGGHGPRRPGRRGSRAPRRPRRRSAGSTCMVRGVALHVHRHPADAGVGGDLAQRGRHVVDERGAGGDGRVGRRRRGGCRSRPARAAPAASTTGSTRRCSSAGSTGAAPGRVDSPPTSIDSRPLRPPGQAMGDGGVGVEEAAAVGEGVGGHVDDTHDRRGARIPNGPHRPDSTPGSVLLPEPVPAVEAGEDDRQLVDVERLPLDERRRQPVERGRWRAQQSAARS